MNEQLIMEKAGTPSIAKTNGPAGPEPAAPRQVPKASVLARATKHKWPLVIALVVIGGLAYYGWTLLQPAKLPEGFVSSNGRIEATEVDIATKIAERIATIEVKEGDFVTAGKVLARMNTDSLKAQLREAQAQLFAFQTSVDTAKSTKKQRESEKAANEATVRQREAELDLAKARFSRAEKMFAKGSIAQEEYDEKRAAFFSAQAAVSNAKAQVAAADAAISTATTTIVMAQASVVATQAKIDRINVDINDCELKAPRDGRVQYKVSQVGEVLSAGGKVLNMVDLSDVYMTFFLPTAWSGRVKIGAQARIVLDAAPQFVIPAEVKYVADVAQFTPKSVETVEERQKLTFRVKAYIPPALLQKYISDVKTGLPGVAYVQLDPQAQWPAHLEVKIPQ
jgi:HlyD family secretion protein